MKTNGMEYNISRRDLLRTAGGIYLASRLPASLVAEEQKETTPEQRRLAKLEYLFDTPDNRRSLRLNTSEFVLISPKGIPLKKSKIFGVDVLEYDPKKATEFEGHPYKDQDGRDIYLLSREYLEGEEAKTKLRTAAEEDKLPLLQPSWYGYIPFDTISIDPVDNQERNKIKKYVDQKDLEVVKKEKGSFDFDSDSILLRFTPNSHFLNVFNAKKHLKEYLKQQSIVSGVELSHAFKL